MKEIVQKIYSHTNLLSNIKFFTSQLVQALKVEGISKLLRANDIETALDAINN